MDKNLDIQYLTKLAKEKPEDIADAVLKCSKAIAEYCIAAKYPKSDIPKRGFLRRAAGQKILWLNVCAREMGKPFLKRCYNIYDEKECMQLIYRFSKSVIESFML